MSSKWIDIIGKVAPTLATAAGGPFAGTAVKFLADKLLGKPDADEGEIQVALQSATPEMLAKLKALDHDFKVKMQELGLKEKDLEVQDRQSARGLFAVNIWPQIVLSTIFIVGYFIVLTKVMGNAITLDEGMKSLVYVLIGVITGEVPRIMAFWFGSSMGSKEKTHKLKGV